MSRSASFWNLVTVALLAVTAVLLAHGALVLARGIRTWREMEALALRQQAEFAGLRGVARDRQELLALVAETRAEVARREQLVPEAIEPARVFGWVRAAAAASGVELQYFSLGQANRQGRLYAVRAEVRVVAGSLEAVVAFARHLEASTAASVTWGQVPLSPPVQIALPVTFYARKGLTRSEG